MKVEDLVKVINERIDEAEYDIACAYSVIGELFIKTHKLNYEYGTELLDTENAIEEWSKVVDHLIDYQTAYAVKEELSFIKYVAEHAQAVREIKKEKQEDTN